MPQSHSASQVEVVGSSGTVNDKRDASTHGTYTAFMLFVYSFLAIISCVTLLNIINSISLSVSARIKQYGAMRAVGMSLRQILRMIIAEVLSTILASGRIRKMAIVETINEL